MLTWQLQDDSGAYQHFSGKLSPDLERASFRQTDPGGVRGILARTSDSCASADLRKSYDYAVSGSTKAMQPGAPSGNVSARGKVDSGDFQVDSDCSVHFLLQDGGKTRTTRGFLVNGGREILGFQTDPGAMVAVRLTAAEN
jgi:hypothetical protein